MTRTQTQILDLFRTLTPSERRELAERIFQDIVLDSPAFELTPDERAALERSQEDFKAGRVLSVDEMQAETDAFLRTLRSRA